MTKMSVHTTSQRRFCKICNTLLPKNVLLEDHDLQVHKIAPRSASSSSGSPSPVTMNTSGRSVRKNNSENRKGSALETPKTTGTSRKSTSTNYFPCEVCGKKYPTVKTRDRHATSHKRRPSPPRVYLRCYECNTQVDKMAYIDHLMFHDIEREDKRRNKNTTGDHEKNGRREGDRKFLYIKPDDPRREDPDAILQCPECPTQLFFSSRKYTEHLLKCKRHLTKMREMHMMHEIKMEVMSD